MSGSQQSDAAGRRPASMADQVASEEMGDHADDRKSDIKRVPKAETVWIEEFREEQRAGSTLYFALYPRTAKGEAAPKDALDATRKVKSILADTKVPHMQDNVDLSFALGSVCQRQQQLYVAGKPSALLKFFISPRSLLPDVQLGVVRAH